MHRLLAIISLFMMMAVGANAATINLMKGGDLRINGDTGTFNVDGVSGTVTADSNLSKYYKPTISQRDWGIGVKASPHDDTSKLDGLYDEWLTFAFDKTVKLVSVTFSHVDKKDDWDVYVDGHLVADESSQNPYYFGHVLADSFKILADGHKCWKKYGYKHCKSTDNFLIKKFTVEHVPAPVPLPASGLLLIGGLAGFGLMRRRKKAA